MYFTGLDESHLLFYFKRFTLTEKGRNIYQTEVYLSVSITIYLSAIVTPPKKPSVKC